MSDDANQDARIATLEREMHDVNKTLYKGNGQPPLVASVAEIRRGMQSQTWLLRVTLATALGSLVKQLLG